VLQGLQGVVRKWTELQPYAGDASLTEVTVPQVHWAKVLQLAKSVKTALPGYKGRIKSVVTVVAEANGVPKESIKSSGSSALDLGVVAEGQWLMDFSGNRTWADGFWVRRLWKPGERLADPAGIGAHEVFFTDSNFGTIGGVAAARLVWDIDRHDVSIQSKGNGGFPRTWTEALDGTVVNPFRTPAYRTEILSPTEGVHAS
jgi:hypothetical protein